LPRLQCATNPLCGKALCSSGGGRAPGLLGIAPVDALERLCGVMPCLVMTMLPQVEMVDDAGTQRLDGVQSLVCVWDQIAP
jgi:hypothetical protein